MPAAQVGSFGVWRWPCRFVKYAILQGDRQVQSAVTIYRAWIPLSAAPSLESCQALVPLMRNFGEAWIDDHLISQTRTNPVFSCLIPLSIQSVRNNALEPSITLSAYVDIGSCSRPVYSALFFWEPYHSFSASLLHR